MKIKRICLSEEGIYSFEGTSKLKVETLSSKKSRVTITHGTGDVLVIFFVGYKHLYVHQLNNIIESNRSEFGLLHKEPTKIEFSFNKQMTKSEIEDALGYCIDIIEDVR